MGVVGELSFCVYGGMYVVGYWVLECKAVFVARLDWDCCARNSSYHSPHRRDRVVILIMPSLHLASTALLTYDYP